MTVPKYQIRYGTANLYTPGSGTILSNGQSLSYTFGVRNPVDVLKASTGSVTCRMPTTLATPPNIGNFIAIDWIYQDSPQLSWPIIVCKITNISYKYAIPYASGVAPLDSITIDFEGAFAQAGRARTIAGYGNSDTYQDFLTNVGSEAGITSSVSNGANPGPAFPFPSVPGTSNSVAERYQFGVNTVQGRMFEAADQLAFTNPSDYYIGLVAFSDTTNNATNQCYDALEFTNYAENLYTKVVVSTLPAATYTASTGSAPFRQYDVFAYPLNAAKGATLASGILNRYSSPEITVSSVSCKASAQSVFKLFNLRNSGAQLNLPSIIGTKVSVVFRGVTYGAMVEGATLTATPEDTRITYFLSGENLNNLFILGDSVWGVLGQNKLGF